MISLFLDTNIVIDLLAKREPFYKSAAELFSLADKMKIQLCVSALTFANTNYILLKELKPEEARLILRKLKLLVKVISLDDKIIGLSLNDSDFKDYEDAIQYYSALESEVSMIITRNLKDFQKSRIPVLTAEQYLQTI
jgi:predicted nucleic acid-binding protein